ncbi:MAG TPA: HAMP domain-containing sensor histidine kinase [Anaerolineales bacterium]|nr:HAMP domain-containing sensor histidine kinase [Anaerolineales bacterium]
MNRNSIRWRLPASYGVIALLAALSLGSVMLLVLRSYYARQEQDYLLGNALALQPILEKARQSELQEGLLQDQIDGLAFLSQTQMRVLDASGRIMADSGVPRPNQVVAVSGMSKWNILPPFESGPADSAEDRMPILIYRNNDEYASEVIPFDNALSSSGPAPQTDLILPVSASPYGYGFVPASQSDPTRRSSYVANILLTASDGSKLGALEISNGPSYGADVIASVTRAWLVASVFAIVIAALAGWFMSKRVTRPVLALENATRQMEQGDLSVRVDLQDEKQQEFISLADSFNGMVAQVEQTISTLREFVADAAHELHTPLTALQANIELARDEGNASARIRYLARAQEQSQRLEALVQSLLDLSRIEATEAKSTFATVDISQLVGEVGEPFASRAEQADRSFLMNLPHETLNVFGNETLLKQVLINLLENSLKFTPRGGSISIDLTDVEYKSKLTISDTGIGIPHEDLPHLFERFHRGRNVAEYAGNGLGLAIAKAIVTRHGGSVSVQSAPGRGTQVIVTIPLYQEA